MAQDVALQADLSNLPLSTTSTANFAQTLLKVVSADNVNPITVLQVQSLGSCFHSNGPWAEKLPDLLARTSSVRLERLSAWVGWVKGDTASFMSQSVGGRAASLICLALGNFYKKERCGMILYNMSQKLLSAREQNSSTAQLSNVSSCLEKKLNCLGFGNHLALQCSRIRLCYFEMGMGIPEDLLHEPTEETMSEFLVCLQQALQQEDTVLRYVGTLSAGVFASLVQSLCPEDVRIEVEGEVLATGQRDSIVISVVAGYKEGSRFRLESKIKTQSNHFQQRYIKLQSSERLNTSLNFSWDGWLASWLDIIMTSTGAKPHNQLKVEVANLVASIAEAFTSNHWCSYGSQSMKENRISKEGIKGLLGPDYRAIICDSLKTVLSEPSEFVNPIVAHEKLRYAVDLCIPITVCKCEFCKSHEPWDYDNYPTKRAGRGYELWKSCQVATFWHGIARVSWSGILCLLIQPQLNPSIGCKPLERDYRAYSFFRSLHLFRGLSTASFVDASYFHNWLWSMVAQWPTSHYLFEDQEQPPVICRSSESSTIFPTTLQYPRLRVPWRVEYALVDGKLHFGADSYGAVICAMPRKGSSDSLRRPSTSTNLVSNGSAISLSALGAHTKFEMAVRPEVVETMQVLLLRSTIHLSTKSRDVNFVDIQLGYLGVSQADSCEHSRNNSLRTGHEYGVIATSVLSPVPTRRLTVGITLTHFDEEAQFLCCIKGCAAFYQGDCCMSCAVGQAIREGIKLVIGGSSGAPCLVEGFDAK